MMLFTHIPWPQWNVQWWFLSSKACMIIVYIVIQPSTIVGAASVDAFHRWAYDGTHSSDDVAALTTIMRTPDIAVSKASLVSTTTTTTTTSATERLHLDNELTNDRRRLYRDNHDIGDSFRCLHPAFVVYTAILPSFAPNTVECTRPHRVWQRYRGGDGLQDPNIKPTHDGNQNHHERTAVGASVSTITSTLPLETNRTDDLPLVIHELLDEQILYNNWRKLIRRTVRITASSFPLQQPTEQIVHFEVVAQKGTDAAVLVFVWNTTSNTTTLIEEYMPACLGIRTGVAAGMVELDKHGGASVDDDNSSVDLMSPELIAAQHELEEECYLTGGTWIRLNDPPVIMDKYSTTRLTAFLVLDPHRIDPQQAHARDDTEIGMRCRPQVSVTELRHLLRTGQLTAVGSWTCLLALDRLQELGKLPHS